jgi:3-oxoacid CoA-transferase
MPRPVAHLAGCVGTIVTDLALLRRTGDGFRIEEVARGFTAEQVAALTGMTVRVADDVQVMQDCC